MAEHTGAAGGDEGHPSPEDLRTYLDGQLDAERTQGVDAHLESCGSCVDALDALEPPVRFPASADTADAWDPRRMRRAVRRTVLRTAVDAAGLLLVGALVLQLLGAVVWVPLAVDRGDRVAASVAASIDLPVMTIPGAEVASYSSNAGFLRRITEVSVERVVGAVPEHLGAYETRLGAVGMSMPGGGPIAYGGPILEGGEGPTYITEFAPDRLGPGTAATVRLVWDDPIALADADAVADATDEVALLWVGFELPEVDAEEPSAPFGYSACQQPPEGIGRRGAGFAGSGGLRVRPGQTTGARHALEQLRRATANLATTGLVSDAAGPLADLDATAAWLAEEEPGVTSVVLTGPTEALAAAVDAASPRWTDLLAVDFDRATPEPCG